MKIDLCSGWKLRYEELEWGIDKAEDVANRTDGWLEAEIPCDVRGILLKYDIIKDPLVGLNCFDSEWIEKKSWWFAKSFRTEKELLEEDIAELVLESLDYGADIFLNGRHIGCRMSSFYPFRQNVQDSLVQGENQLLIRLTTGIERVDSESMKPYTLSSEEERRTGRGDKRKAFLRKPQYSFGWDWSPRVATCGIMKGVWLECHKKAVIRDAHISVKTLSPEVVLDIELEVECLTVFSTKEALFEVRLDLNDEIAAGLEFDQLLISGMNYIRLEVPVRDAKLWWPNGMGDQPIYNVKVRMEVEGSASIRTFQYGIRTIVLDMPVLRAGERLFAFCINGVRIFCKGANWIPADAVYASVSDEKYEGLVREAKTANFNMLRIWGGGLYERDVFYEACDRNGILIWHDFMFACSEYPDDREWFAGEVEKELDYQTKRLRNHPSIALWCGNNECDWGFYDWGYNGHYGQKIYNYIAPEAVRRNCPGVPYWSGSPCGGENPNGVELGDRHHWFDCMMNPDMQKRIVPEEFDKVGAKFVSEYGYVGPLKKASIQKYMDGAPLDIDGDVWQHHNNTFEKDTVLAGIKYHYRDTEAMDIDSYLLYAGLCQGVMYGYSLEALRFKPECSGALFWMYNDCWGETGWTIIDYYMTRKIPFYFVKRAFEPVKLILREKCGLVQVTGCNDGPGKKELEVEYGFVAFDGGYKSSKTGALVLEPYSRSVVLEFDQLDFDARKGTYFVKAINSSEVTSATLRKLPFRELDIPPASPVIKAAIRSGAQVILTVESKTFTHAVHFRLQDDLRLSDEYFDLLPGEYRDIIVYDEEEKLRFEELKAYFVGA
jgi:beta-mannosidase